MSKIKYKLFCTFIVALLIVIAIASLCIGQYKISMGQVFAIFFDKIFSINIDYSEAMYRIVWLVRLPRIVAAILVGTALALAGTAYQGVFRNPLVSPDLLGVSHGACVGVAVSIIADLGYWGNVVFSFIGGLIAVLITVLIPILIKKNSTITLVLSGVIVGGFFSSVLGLIKYIADPDTELAEITYWQLGSLAKVKPEMIAVVAPIILFSAVIIYLLRWRINIISLGDRDARTLGVNIARERGAIVVCSTLLTAASICMCGTISWIGLVMPHLARMIVGQNNERVLPVSAVLSASFLLLVDVLARNLTGAEIPLSIITGFIGTPFFAIVLIKQKT